MATDYTSTSYLVPATKRHALVPLASSTMSDSDILAILNEELLSLAAGIAKERQEFFVRRLVDTAFVADQESYAINTRALCAVVRDAVVVQSDGSVRNLQLRSQERAVGTEEDSGPPAFCFLEGGYVVVRPVPQDATESLRLPILERPNAIVASSATRQVSSSTSTQIVLTTNAPGTFTTSSPLDIIEGKPPFKTLARDVAPTNVSSATLTFAAGVLPSGLAANDYVALAQESPVAQLPPEWQPVLTLRACANALDSLNQSEKAAAKRAKADAEEKRLLALIRPRMKGEVRKLQNGMAKWSMGGSDGGFWWRAT